jgi:hypothetical protein
MSSLLINGCSYTVNWNQTCREFGKKLNFENTINLSLRGSSNDRIFRSTLEYIFKNKVDFVILALTFWDRQEAPWAKEGTWTDYSSKGIVRPSEVASPDIYDSYIQDSFRYDIDNNYIDKLLNNIITFSGWLDSQNIKYLIFSSPGGHYAEPGFLFNHYKNTIEKLAYVRKNPRLIDGGDWSSNRYMADNGGVSEERDLESNIKHYNADSFNILNRFIIDYVKKHNLL